VTGTGTPPSRIHALVVGVEKYRAGASWDLPGPARDALRFCDWLLARGVPEKNILLCLSAVPGPSAAVPHLPADYDTLRELAVSRLPAANGDLLWLWWGGHGVLDREESLRLLTADATKEDKRNLHLQSLLRRLASDALPGFPRQIMFVDACQDFEEHLNLHDSLPTDLLPAGRRVQHHDQAVLLAASRGQRAANDPVRRTGLFSDQVLRVLEDVPHAAPDADPLFDAIHERFVEVSTRTGQKPYVLRERTERGREILGPPHPDPGPTPPTVSIAEARRRLVDVLVSYPKLLREHERDTLVGLLGTRRVENMNRSDNPRSDLVNIVVTLEDAPSELWLLPDAVLTLDGDERRAVALTEAIESYPGLRRPDPS
jgi:hypothetical protein